MQRAIPRLLGNATTRKPMATARRVALFEREVRLKLSPAALEILFGFASVLSEGQLEEDGYFGSTMITIDVARAASMVTEACDAATARCVADLFASDKRVRSRAKKIAVREAQQRIGGAPRAAQVDFRVRASGAHVHVDVDVEVANVRVVRD